MSPSVKLVNKSVTNFFQLSLTYINFANQLICNSLPDRVVMADTVNQFKSHNRILYTSKSEAAVTSNEKPHCSL